MVTARIRNGLSPAPTQDRFHGFEQAADVRIQPITSDAISPQNPLLLDNI
jgi:hypothetical protein